MSLTPGKRLALKMVWMALQILVLILMARERLDFVYRVF